MIDFLQLLIYGIVLGSILTLGAIGASLVYGILRFANFAHGDMMTVGAYLALVAVTTTGMSVYVALPFAMIGGAAIAIFFDQIVYKRLRRTVPIILLISSFSTALILRSVTQLIWGPKNQVYEAGISLPYVVGGVRIRPDHVTIFVGSVLLIIAFHLFLKYTMAGKAMRAMSDNVDLARISGVNSERVFLWTWAIGGALAAAAGVFLALDTRLHPEMGWHVLLAVFAAVIVGGIGRPYGAIAGGMIIGVATELSTMVFEPAYKPAVAFALMVIVLVLRPTGVIKGQP